MSDIQIGEPTLQPPTVRQIVSTTKNVDKEHKINYFFMMMHGDPIGEYWTTQAMQKGTLVKVQGLIHEVDSLDVDWEEKHIVCLLGPALYFQEDGSLSTTK